MTFLPKLIFLSAVLVLLKIEHTTNPTNRVANAGTISPFGPETKASVNYEITAKKVNREEALAAFLTKYNSPLTPSAKTFVEVADKYSIDYRILPAISCIESGCGKHLIQGTYNPFGWGKGTIKFESYDHAIIRVGQGLDEIYLRRGLTTVEKIAPVYNPPSPDSWTSKVNYFMNQIRKYELEA